MKLRRHTQTYRLVKLRLFALAVLYLAFMSYGGVVAYNCSEADSAALLSFKAQMLGNDTAFESWLPSTDCCQMAGIAKNLYHLFWLANWI